MKLCRWNNGHRFSLCSPEEISTVLALQNQQQLLERLVAPAHRQQQQRQARTPP
jgi:hypothetical protein